MPPQDQVYLNYRATLRRNFVSHLHRALVSENINAFWDGDEKHEGLTVKESLRSIEESKIALAIFSPRYTESEWCVKELDRIMDCTVKGSLVPIPIFYNVEPSKVKLLEGDFGNKFKRWANRNVMEKKWAAAFKFVSDMSGITVDGNSNESDMIDRIVTEVKRLLKQIPSEVSFVPVVKEMPPQYQVYLNYRADLRRNFVSHLNRALVSENINAFWDGGEEHKGLTVKESLRRIEESRIALAIFSSKYTESVWCIKELDRITECTVKGSLVPIPIFYNVEPSKVKSLAGDFGSKFKRLADGNAMEEKWAAAFKFVSNMSGITIDDNSNESDMIDRIVAEVKRVLKQIPSEVCSVSTVKKMPPQDQVFLNFRADVQWSFVSHLNRALVSENINVYWDRDEKLEVVSVKESLRRIEESRIALAIFSPRYPESEWCVKELDRIRDCSDKGSLVTIPIFYKVEPSKVKFLEGDFGSKFKRLAHGNLMEMKWAAAFKFVSNIKGITVYENSDESKIIEHIVTDVKRVLQQIPSGKTQEVCSVSAVKEMPPQDQVFLNFRNDVQWNFVSHLNRALVSENINVFWDCDEKHKGVTVNESLRRIEESRIALAIFSPKYPESHWCIKELDRITDCTVKGSLVTIPIFYKVEPFKVEFLEGDFGSKFKRSADGNVMETKWATAFKFVSNMTGITVDGNSDESKMIDRIVTDVKRVLKQIQPAESREASSSVDPSENIDTGNYGIKQRVKVLVQKMDLNNIRNQLGMIKFLPQDYISLAPRWQEFSSKKELYLALSGNPVLIDDGKKRLWLEKASGKRCIMLPAMDLHIKWAENLKYWLWVPDARFGKIAKLIEVCWFDIIGSINTRFLSPATRYSAYIVFKKGDGCEGFKDTPVDATIKEVGKEASRRFIYFDVTMDDHRNIVKPKERQDGWREVELGEFFTEEVWHREIEIRILEGDSSKWKRRLIILGIEIRPAKIHYGNSESKHHSRVVEELNEGVKRVLEYIHAERTDNIIDKSVTCGAKPVRSSSDPTTSADFLDSKIVPPQIQVFINFRGVQLRNNFVGYLVHGLRKREVNVFIDNYEKRGEDLDTLFKRIEKSGIALAVFSSRYTESKWCLDELVKIEECARQGLLKVIPIFYKVSPTDVKRLKGEFGDHFRDKEHMYGFDSPLIKAWKDAIVGVCRKHAMVYDENSGVSEAVFVDSIVKEVLEMLQSISTGESSQSSN